MKKAIVLAAATLLTLASCEKEREEPECPPGEYIDGMMWMTVYQPVCGCDNVTYSNSGHAAAYGITDYTEGECGGN